LGEAQFAGDLVDEVLDVVADAASAVRAEVGEVLPQLGGVDSGDGREFLRGGGRGAALGQRPERAQIHRQPGHGRLWNGRGAAGGTFAAAARGAFAPGALGTQGGHRAPEGAVAVGLLPERATWWVCLSTCRQRKTL